MTKILVVEDNEMNMKLFYDILSFQGYVVDKAIDGLMAYEMIKKNSYDLIILDILLPELDGLSLIKKLKKDNIKYPDIIITSACAMDDDKNNAKELGIEDYITKPIDINVFLKAVKDKVG